MNRQQHEFALYLNNALILKRLEVGERFALTDDQARHRLTHVVRLRDGESCIFFDGLRAMRACLEQVTKKEMIFSMLEQLPVIVPQPAITFLLPLLKKEALERSLYSLVELGVQRILLVITEKSQKSLTGLREMERLQAIMVGAAEQAKHFALPTLEGPLSLADALREVEPSSSFLFADPQGDALAPVLARLHEHSSPSLTLMVGPEGDLTLDEKEKLHAASVQFCRLTPTVLRAQQAVAVFTGSVRSLL